MEGFPPVPFSISCSERAFMRIFSCRNILAAAFLQSADGFKAMSGGGLKHD